MAQCAWAAACLHLLHHSGSPRRRLMASGSAGSGLTFCPTCGNLLLGEPGSSASPGGAIRRCGARAAELRRNEPSPCPPARRSGEPRRREHLRLPDLPLHLLHRALGAFSAGAAAARPGRRRRRLTRPPASSSLLQITKGVPLKRKEVEPVLGGEEEWKNAPRTEGAPARRPPLAASPRCCCRPPHPPLGARPGPPRPSTCSALPRRGVRPRHCLL